MFSYYNIIIRIWVKAAKIQEALGSFIYIFKIIIDNIYKIQEALGSFIYIFIIVINNIFHNV